MRLKTIRNVALIGLGTAVAIPFYTAVIQQNIAHQCLNYPTFCANVANSIDNYFHPKPDLTARYIAQTWPQTPQANPDQGQGQAQTLPHYTADHGLVHRERGAIRLPRSHARRT